MCFHPPQQKLIHSHRESKELKPSLVEIDNNFNINRQLQINLTEFMQVKMHSTAQINKLSAGSLSVPG